MRKPRIPPNFEHLSEKLESQMVKVINFNATRFIFGEKPKPYLHWDDVLRRDVPKGLADHEEWWYAIKLERRMQNRALYMKDKLDMLFTYTLADPIPEMLNQIDLGAGGVIEMPDQITNPDTRDRYYVQSLIEEAITSSQLEGAATTRQVAKEMLRTGRPPRDKNEQMILNNFVAMRRIGGLKNRPLSKELVFEIHRLVTKKTLDNESASGRFRRDDEPISVVDPLEGEVFHSPPPADQLEERMSMMCAFANGILPEPFFLHPVLRSIILHFWLAYDHPFIDGNGRTARALFYWSMLRHRYSLFEFISISHILHKAPQQYARSFLLTETDENDMTYFILYQLDVIKRAIDELHKYINRKTREVQAIERRIKASSVFNHRQMALLSHALRHPQHQYTFDSHRGSHDVTYQTARTDLLELERRGLLTSKKIGKRWYFTPVPELETKLENLGE